MTVLRNGMRVFTGLVAQTSRQDIILHMTGRALTDGFPAKDTPAGGPIAQAADVQRSRYDWIGRMTLGERK